MSHKEHKKSNNSKKFFLLLVILFILIGALVFVLFKDAFSFTKDTIASPDNLSSSSSPNPPTISANDAKYGVVKKDDNSNYMGIGQEQVAGKNGYFTTFSTAPKTNPQLNDSVIPANASTNEKLYKEYKQNGDASWANNPYWDGTMETDGCGITALSIVLSRIW